MSEIYQLPDNGNNNGTNIPFSIPIGFGGMGYGYNNGFGSFGNGIFDIFGLALVASMFGWGGGNGFGGWGNNGGSAQIAALSSQLNTDSGRELLMNAITSQGEAQRSAVQNLATMVGQDFNLLNSGVQNVQNALATIAANQGMNVMQVVNAIQSGNCQLANQFSQCCCQTQKQILEQGYQSQIATLNQTNQLGSQADRNTNSLLNAINAADIITQLRGQIDNAAQTNQIIGYVNSVIAPLQKTVTEIADKQLPTVPVVYPNIQAVNNTPYMGGFNGFYGNGFGGNVIF